MKKILIANRGEIAVRIIKTCRELGIASVAVASEADAQARHVREADEVQMIGPAAVTASYLNIDAILEAARLSGADAIHPGFGFLSENPIFSRRVTEAGLTFIGPGPEIMAVMGSKQISKRRMVECGVPVVPGYNGDDQSPARLFAEAERIGYPLLIKASAGGGGKGMRVVHQGSAFQEELDTAKREALSAFGDDTVLLEKYLVRPRHIEFQVFGDTHGQVVHLFERECSIQRRHQKIIEETPSPALYPELRHRMAEAALAAARAVDYVGAGTVEFMLDQDDSFYFLEMNTRLQVEHPVTELTTGVDLVRWQILVARGEKLPLSQDQITQRGHALEARIYAEDPGDRFFPQTGKILRYHEPVGLGIRVDSGVAEGDEVSIYYDPMLAKLITYGESRTQSIAKMKVALEGYCIHGVKTNLAFLHAIVGEETFVKGELATDYLSRAFPDYRPADTFRDRALALTVLARTKSSTSAAASASAEVWDALRSWRASV